MSPSAVSSNETMDSVVHEVQNAYQSARLQYVKIDEADEHIKAFIPQVENDPVIQALSSPDLLRPKGKKDLDWYAEQQAKAFLGVAICLLPAEEAKAQAKVETEAGTKQPTIIGTMCLGWGGIAPAMAHHRTAAIGITLGSGYLNKGYGREAINWVLDWGFKHGGLHTINLATYSYNERAAHLYQDMGFRLEGRKKEVAWFNRKWYDELWYGMTEHEWEKLRGYS
ncbi:acetyltransferase (GNAT) domain-containing protein [Hirsutella rhossiliensis]|uniref:Acetyltransferase (GNAT) domain-containing protein n=1 Tax=Hirsutella rhossiliensis TaxID=111463 RepID=A0A9P8SMA0_9HYPO|nr:acetyltransferase (GNAT) domain-containing protein [Hirsutella rhossiliensis]KAH0966620.1 acetyltransferase (GNAT) domain-containing protein [Hirsutella rhossiliensis]